MPIKNKLLIFVFILSFKLSAQNRIALVIGNSDYSFTTKLDNTINDAKIISGALKKVNFKVIYKENLNKKEFKDQIKNFINLVNDSTCEAGFFYYAGHGIQYDNKNYLVPTDAEINDPEDAEDCIPLDKLNKIVCTNNKVIITVLDACRNNPFETSRSLGNGGLAKTNAVSGSLIAYSTEPGKVAFDGKGMENSIYSKTLARYITEPNLALEQVFKLVRTEVEQKTKNQQSPREESALKGETFYFNKKTDYSKIDIKEIENEMNALSLNKKYNEALLKGNVLKNIYQDRMDSISRLKYVAILLNIAKINWQIANDTIHPLESYQWINYYKNGSVALYDAIEVFKKNALNTNQHKLVYSKLLINYISLQSILNQDDRIGSVDNLNSLANELIKFNEFNFGFYDYKTACAYFHSGYLKTDSMELESYNYINKSYKILNYINNSNNLKKNEDYIFDDASEFFYIIKWSLKSLNNLIFSDLKNEEINKLLHSNPTILYNNTKTEIENNITYLGSVNESRIKDYLYECSRFYNDYSLILNDKPKDKLLEDALISNDRELKYCNDYSDSIYLFKNRIKILNNLLDFKTKKNKNYNPISESEFIFNYLNECIRLAHNNNDSYLIIVTTEYLIETFDELKNYNKKYFNNENLYIVLDKFNEEFGNVMSDYKISKNKDNWNERMDSYFDKLRRYFLNHDSVNFKYKLIEAEQFIEYASDVYGYGSPKHLAAMEHYAIKLGESNNQEDQEESHKLYIKLIKLNNQYSKRWTEKDIEDFTGNKNKEVCISILLSDLYLNYGNNLITNLKDVNNSEDSTLINSYFQFTDEYKATLISLGRFYSRKIPVIQLMVLYYFNSNPQKSIEYCDLGLSLLHERLKLDTAKAKLDELNDYYAEEYITWFFDKKLEIIEKIKPYDYSKVSYQYKVDAKKFKTFVNYYTILTIYNNLLNHYYFIDKDFNLVKKAAKEAYSEFGSYLNSKEFLSSDYNNEYKLYTKRLLNNILAFFAETSCSPSKADRKLCIDECKKTVDFIYKTWSDEDLKINKDVIEELINTLYTVADVSYFLGDYKTAFEYYNKQLDVIELFNSYIDSKEIKKSTLLHTISSAYFKINDTLNATLSYCNYVNNTKDLDTTLINNINYTLENKNFNTCTIPYLHLIIYTPLNSWPSLEFDVNNNSKIDSLSDLRYFIDTNNVLNKENIKNLNQNIGGYYYNGFDPFGKKMDTTANIFFDKNKPLKTQAYFQTQKLKINSELKFGKLKTGEQLNKWDIFIPLEELKCENNNSVNLIYSNISVGESVSTLSRRYDKNPIPSKSYYTGFKDGIKIKIE